MKEYEKLAEEFEIDEHGLDTYLSLGGGDGYKAGFLKAREMALHALSEENWIIGTLSEVLSNLGEKEV